MTPRPILISTFHLYLLLRIGSFSCIFSIEILYACCKLCPYSNQETEDEECELRSVVSMYTYNFPCPSSLVPTSIISWEGSVLFSHVFNCKDYWASIEDEWNMRMECVWNHIHRAKPKYEDGNLPCSNLFNTKATWNCPGLKSSFPGEESTVNHLWHSW
jgi:hypothetical protein